MKKSITLKESELRNVIQENLKKILSEGNDLSYTQIQNMTGIEDNDDLNASVESESNQDMEGQIWRGLKEVANGENPYKTILNFHDVANMLEQKFGFRYVGGDEEQECHDFSNGDYVLYIFPVTYYPQLGEFQLENYHGSHNYRFESKQVKLTESELKDLIKECIVEELSNNSRYFSPRDITQLMQRAKSGEKLSRFEHYTLEAALWARARSANYHGYSDVIPAVEYRDGVFYAETKYDGMTRVSFNYDVMTPEWLMKESKSHKIQESLEDEMNLWKERDESEFGQTIRQLDNLMKEMFSEKDEYGFDSSPISRYVTMYALDGNMDWTAKTIAKVVENYDMMQEPQVKALVKKMFDLAKKANLKVLPNKSLNR